MAALDGVCCASKFFKGKRFEPCVPPRFFELGGGVEHGKSFVGVTCAQVVAARQEERTPSIFGAFVDGGFDEFGGIGGDLYRETYFFPFDVEEGGVVGGVGELEGEAFTVRDSGGGGFDLCDGMFGVVLGAACPSPFVSAEEERPCFFSGDGEDVVGSGFDEGFSEGGIVSELDLGSDVCACAPDLAVRNETAPDLAAFHGGAMVGDADLGDADSLHDFGARTWEREFERMGSGGCEAGSSEEAEYKGDSAEGGSWGRLCVHRFLLCEKDEEEQRGAFRQKHRGTVVQHSGCRCHSQKFWAAFGCTKAAFGCAIAAVGRMRWLFRCFASRLQIVSGGFICLKMWLQEVASRER